MQYLELQKLVLQNLRVFLVPFIGEMKWYYIYVIKEKKDRARWIY